MINLDKEEKIITETSDLLYQQLEFKIKEEKSIQSIEVWSYDSNKKIGTIFIKNYQFIDNFEHSFKKHNLLLNIRTI